MLAAGLHAQSPSALRITEGIVTGHHTGRLSWTRLDSASAYQLYRRYPDQATFSLIATLADTHYTDTLSRIVCADTVSYFVDALAPVSTLRSDTAGLYYQDNIPTAACHLRLCSVDTLLSRLRLTWYPSPDTDVMGYYLCMGSPCRDYDTVWGRLNTTYLCPDDLSLPQNIHREYNFRLLAFDSCYQASPLTPYFHNPVLTLSAPPCSRSLSCSWNRYINMPDSVASYILHYRLLPDTHWRTHRVGPQGPFQFDTTVADLAIGRVDAYLSVHNRSDSLQALSVRQTFNFDYGDTARYARILSAAYLDTVPAIALTLEVDPSFAGNSFTLLRASATPSASDPSVLVWTSFLPLASLQRPAAQPLLSYTDSLIHRSVAAYAYQLAVPDLCGQRSVFSDTATVAIPPMPAPAAWFPNIIRAGHPDLGLFCPRYLSPLAQNYRLDIFTRWGQLVFSSRSLDHCWDGTNLYGRPLPQGVYVYRARCHHADGTVKTYKGTVTLLR